MKHRRGGAVDWFPKCWRLGLHMLACCPEARPMPINSCMNSCRMVNISMTYGLKRMNKSTKLWPRWQAMSQLSSLDVKKSACTNKFHHRPCYFAHVDWDLLPPTAVACNHFGFSFHQHITAIFLLEQKSSTRHG